MHATAEAPIRLCLESLGRMTALSICVVMAGCALVEGSGSPTANKQRVMLGANEGVEVSRRHEAVRNYQCLEGVLMCDDGAVTQRCHCSTTGVILLR